MICANCWKAIHLEIRSLHYFLSYYFAGHAYLRDYKTTACTSIFEVGEAGKLGNFD